jgi:hypothetical protein
MSLVGHAVLALVLLSQEPTYNEPTFALDEICGKLVRVVEIQDKKHGGALSEKTKALGGAKLLLYPRSSGISCCSGNSPSDEVATNRRGEFLFKVVPSGAYWVVARVDDQAFKVPILYQTAKTSQGPCSLNFFKIDLAGRFTYTTTITVD